MEAITGKDGRHAAEDARGLCSSYPEVDGIPVHYRFAGRGKKDTRVVDAMEGALNLNGAVEACHGRASLLAATE